MLISPPSFQARHPSSSWPDPSNFTSAPSLPVSTSIDAYEPSASAICCVIRPLTIPSRPTMFKWNRMKVSSGEPITPKLAPANLPDADSWRGSPTPKVSPTTTKSLKYFLGRLTPDRRAETPHPAPIPSHRRKEAHVPRLRTVSLSKHDDEIVLLKPHKAPPPTAPTYVKPYTTPSPEIEKPQVTRTSPRYVPATVHPLPVSAGARRASNPEHQSVPLKSALKGGSNQTQTVAVKQEFPPVSLERRTSSRKVSISPQEISTCITTTPAQEDRASVNGRGQHIPSLLIKPLANTFQLSSKKGEAIAVSWPLADFASRAGKGTPSLYFDVGFDPRKDEWAVRVDRGGFWGPIKRDEADISVSPHTTLNEMKIDLHVRRSSGLRCIDIFRGIFDTYNVVLTEKDKAQIGAAYLKRCERAFKQR
ncbi:hypothetical protein D9756_009599 [Leucocoprinus leucothites]|uniref:Uncharacterized protein n=1 Tax=Leucocoprinus leucothites TaxID=201217 RepID=A0A8H5FTI1_9AGAR|nr:hypothetical protein D9756_009599 [Leucoagaricus leucothites]